MQNEATLYWTEEQFDLPTSSDVSLESRDYHGSLFFQKFSDVHAQVVFAITENSLFQRAISILAIF